MVLSGTRYNSVESTIAKALPDNFADLYMKYILFEACSKLCPSLLGARSLADHGEVHTLDHGRQHCCHPDIIDDFFTCSVRCSTHSLLLTADGETGTAT